VYINEIVKIDTGTLQVVGRATMGNCRGAVRVVTTPVDGRTLVVNCADNGRALLVDAGTLNVKHEIRVGTMPIGIAVPDDRFGFPWRRRRSRHSARPLGPHIQPRWRAPPRETPRSLSAPPQARARGRSRPAARCRSPNRPASFRPARPPSARPGSTRASAASSEFRTKSRIEEHLAHARAAVAALDAVSEEESSRQMHRARERAVHETQARLEAAFKEFAKLEAAQSRVDRVSIENPLVLPVTNIVA
jgi:hypothetical protein